MTSSEQKLVEAFDVSRETLEKLRVYESLVRKWSRRINLVSPNTLEDIWTRHFLDSAQLVTLVPETTEKWVDFGSGGGFPGLVVSLLRPNLRMTLIESDQRKSVFLRTAVRETGAHAEVKSARIEDLESENADVVSARALADLPTLLEFALHHVKSSGIALFPRGAQFAKDIESALETHNFRCETHPSVCSRDSRILKITEIERV